MFFWAPIVFAQEGEALKRALEARAAGDWARAFDEARETSLVGQDIIKWHRLRAKRGTFEEAQTFLARRSDWPGLPYLRQQSEHDITSTDPAGEVIAFFADQVPRTGNGSLRYAEALRRNGRAGDADAELIHGWVTHSLTRAEEAEFISR
ncbi:MAG: lytic transglycosylase domain-containing protein, partial [Pseudomonadota bacterium]